MFSFHEVLLSSTLGLLTGILGSPHCLIMCGACSLKSVKKNRDFIFFQFGRLIGYNFIFAFSYWIFKDQLGVFFQNQLYYVVLSISVLILGLSLNTHTLLRSMNNINMPKWFHSSLSQGFLMAIIPCGWLWAIIVVVPFVTDLEWLFILFFWIGSLTAFIFAEFIKQYSKTKSVVNKILEKKSLFPIILIFILSLKVIGGSHLHIETLRNYISVFSKKEIPMKKTLCTGSQTETISN